MRSVLKLAVLSAVAAAPLAAQLDSAAIAGFRWRNIGPANHQGRIVDVDGIPWPSGTYYVSTAGGGVWKTINAGTTFRPVFENERVSSGGMLAIAPSDTNTVYYGTGEPNGRNSVSPGAGVWKTTNGGRTWEFLGLKETQHIGRVVVDPKNKDVYGYFMLTVNLLQELRLLSGDFGNSETTNALAKAGAFAHTHVLPMAEPGRGSSPRPHASAGTPTRYTLVEDLKRAYQLSIVLLATGHSPEGIRLAVAALGQFPYGERGEEGARAVYATILLHVLLTSPAPLDSAK